MFYKCPAPFTRSHWSHFFLSWLASPASRTFCCASVRSSSSPSGYKWLCVIHLRWLNILVRQVVLRHSLYAYSIKPGPGLYPWRTRRWRVSISCLALLFIRCYGWKEPNWPRIWGLLPHAGTLSLRRIGLEASPLYVLRSGMLLMLTTCFWIVSGCPQGKIIVHSPKRINPCTPPTGGAPKPDPLVNGVTPPITPCWSPGVIIRRNSIGRGYGVDCSALALCIWTVVVSKRVSCTGCDGAGNPYCSPAPEVCQGTGEVNLVHTHRIGSAPAADIGY